MQSMETMYISNNSAVSSLAAEESRRMKAEEVSLGVASRMSLALLIFSKTVRARGDTWA